LETPKPAAVKAANRRVKTAAMKTAHPGRVKTAAGVKSAAPSTMEPASAAAGLGVNQRSLDLRGVDRELPARCSAPQRASAGFSAATDGDRAKISAAH
jgi:hypothetical protein